MNSNEELFYEDNEGGGSNVHPINSILSEREKIEVLCEFETLLQVMRNNKENVGKGFHMLINIMNSPN
ncbi:MAG: hypothetical protein AAF620_01270 [Bacteroidota bacterium]